jgi:predicted nucleic-acid-binding protein
VETIDTNVLVRLVVADDAEQCQRAERAWRKSVLGAGAYIPVVVLVELTWVLRIAYKFDRKTIVGALRLDGCNFAVPRLMGTRTANNFR